MCVCVWTHVHACVTCKNGDERRVHEFRKESGVKRGFGRGDRWIEII